MPWEAMDTMDAKDAMGAMDAMDAMGAKDAMESYGCHGSDDSFHESGPIAIEATELDASLSLHGSDIPTGCQPQLSGLDGLFSAATKMHQKELMRDDKQKRLHRRDDE
jgi:hypothetical protein